MVEFAILITTVGLGMDILGAALVTLPDVPHLREHLWSNKIRRGMERMEMTGLHESHPGHDEVQNLLSNLYGVDISKDVIGFRVGLQNLSQFSQRAIFALKDVNGGGEQLGHIGYGGVNLMMENRIRHYEAKIRGFGFALLAIGIGLQAMGLFLR